MDFEWHPGKCFFSFSFYNLLLQAYVQAQHIKVPIWVKAVHATLKV